MGNSSKAPRTLTLDKLQSRVESCEQCNLHKTRTNTVFGEGNPDARIIFVGEGPGEVEDNTGRPFVGRAGQKLDEVLASVDINREDVYIGNVVKCRPPDNRVPNKKEMETCSPYLEAQIALINPEVIVTLGNTPTQWLLPGTAGMTSVHGTFLPWRGGIQIFPMFHPSYLLRNPSRAKGSPKYLTWVDIKKIRELLNEQRAGNG